MSRRRFAVLAVCALILILGGWALLGTPSSTAPSTPASPDPAPAAVGVPTSPGAQNRSKRRIVTGGAPLTNPPLYFYTGDHCDSFCLVTDVGRRLEDVPRGHGTFFDAVREVFDDAGVTLTLR